MMTRTHEVHPRPGGETGRPNPHPPSKVCARTREPPLTLPTRRGVHFKRWWLTSQPRRRDHGDVGYTRGTVDPENPWPPTTRDITPVRKPLSTPPSVGLHSLYTCETQGKIHQIDSESRRDFLPWSPDTQYRLRVMVGGGFIESSWREGNSRPTPVLTGSSLDYLLGLTGTSKSAKYKVREVYHSHYSFKLLQLKLLKPLKRVTLNLYMY